MSELKQQLKPVHTSSSQVYEAKPQVTKRIATPNDAIGVVWRGQISSDPAFPATGSTPSRVPQDLRQADDLAVVRIVRLVPSSPRTPREAFGQVPT
jgi:hypothetical protein